MFFALTILLFLTLRSPSSTEVLSFPHIAFDSDKDQDGIDDLADILAGAKKDVQLTTAYDPAYYDGGFPPDGRGVCTDVIWRSFKNAGYDLKSLVDKDILEHAGDYPFDEAEPDENIDFRRVTNLLPFFKKYGTTLTNDVVVGNHDNLSQWQGGDIVIYDASRLVGMHIGIVSDKRTDKGIPYIIHNYAHGTREENLLTFWPAPIIGHFRFPKKY